MEKVTRYDLNAAFENILKKIEMAFEQLPKQPIQDKPYSISDYIKQYESKANKNN